MQFEQPAELNRYVDESIPLTWTFRWRALKPSLPLLICGSLFLVEWVAFRLWLNGRSVSSELPVLVVCTIFPVVLIMLAFEALVRITHRSKRRLQLDAKRVSFSPAKNNRIALKQICGWRLEPVAQAPELSKLTLEYSLARNRKPIREWSMVLRSEQKQTFLSEVEQMRQLGLSDAKVVRLTGPLVRRKAIRPFRSMVAVALGFYLLMHGLPLVVAAAFPSSGDSGESRSKREWTAEEKTRFRRFVLAHFATLEEFRRFMIIAGGSLTVLGAGFYFWGISSIKRNTALVAAEGGKNARTHSVAAEPVKSIAFPR